ncbi:hypothetical protein MTO96_051530 [Rhipicephalus appendiculatus]
MVLDSSVEELDKMALGTALSQRFQHSHSHVRDISWTHSRSMVQSIYHNVFLKNSTRVQFQADVTWHTGRCCKAGKEGFNVGKARAVLALLLEASVLD